MNESPEKIRSLPGVHLIGLPNSYSTDKSNCYFIDGTAPTLIDTGVATREAYESLASALSKIGRRIQDIERIILTHGHADHRALAPRIVEESGADVFCHELEASKTIRSPRSQKESHKENASAVFRSMGVPEKLLPQLVSGPKNPAITPRLDHVSFVHDGAEIPLDDRELRVLHTPGHSCGSICLHDSRSEALFTGDTLLSGSHITALLETDMIAEDADYNGLKLHTESLRRLLALAASLVLPGHGPIINEYETIVAALLERHEKRRRHILRALRHGPRSLYQICRSAFLFTPSNDLYLALSEVTGNLGILIEEGKVARREEAEMTYYESV